MTWPLTVQVDNEQARSFVYGTCLNSRLRGCVDMRLQWVQDIRKQVGTGQVQVKYVHTKDNMADVLTKCLPAWKFNNTLDKIQNSQRDKHYVQFLKEMEY